MLVVVGIGSMVGSGSVVGSGSMVGMGSMVGSGSVVGSGSIVGWGSPLATESIAASGPTSGGLFTIASVGSGKYADVYGASKADGTKIVQYPLTGYTNQQWTTKKTGASSYTIVNVNSAQCLTVAGGSTSPGAAVVQSTCLGSDATQQLWNFSSTGSGGWKVTSGVSGLCLAVSGDSTASSAAVVQSACTGSAGQQWRLDSLVRVAAWGPALNSAGISFTNQTIRQVVHVSTGGTAPRIRVSNLKGSSTLTVGEVDVAVQSSGAQAVTGTQHQVLFGGAKTLQLSAGTERVSDPIRMVVPPEQNLLVSIYVTGTSGPSSWHPAAHDTTYISSTGDHASEDGVTNYPTTTSSWYLLDRLDLTSSTAVGTLVAFGDSITDGTGSTQSANDRWPDYLDRRLEAVSGGPKFGIVDAAIAGNRVLTDRGTTFGDSGLSRFAHDAIGAGAVKDVILLEGINDINTTTLTAADLEAGYQTLIDQTHAAGARIFGATMTPFGGYSAYTADRESLRQAVNTWIRTSGAFDGVIDFDAALRNPSAPSTMAKTYDSGDHLHPNDAGYQAMANAINLSAL